MPVNETTARVAGKAEAARKLRGNARREALVEVLVGGMLLLLQNLKDQNGGEHHEKDELQQLEDKLQQIADAMHGEGQ